ncbi:hypothetical protein MHUMG1_10174 [Metarhizium humberi]|uniref:Condensation domain-containing protein n=1 Tax=Metarhizium humberi TaxID=2596975 RepID=A0A9P8S2Q2_9HYPO|nr:hypothetical protein MHUMG1_10174 [Metarhizium humberi]
MTPLSSATDKASSISRQDEDSERQHPGAEIDDEKSHPRAGTVEEEAIPAKVHPDLNQDIITMERMSAAQSRIFVLGNLMKDPTAYSLIIRYDTVSELDIHRLRDALTTTMQHHDSLRTCFFARSQDNQPMQGLLLFPVRRSKHVPYATGHDIEQELQASRDKVWDIEHGETLSLTVLSQSSKKHTLILGYHHIISDASSMRRFMRDLNSAYNMRPLKRDLGLV